MILLKHLICDLERFKYDFIIFRFEKNNPHLFLLRFYCVWNLFRRLKFFFCSFRSLFFSLSARRFHKQTAVIDLNLRIVSWTVLRFWYVKFFFAWLYFTHWEAFLEILFTFWFFHCILIISFIPLFGVNRSLRRFASGSVKARIIFSIVSFCRWFLKFGFRCLI